MSTVPAELRLGDVPAAERRPGLPVPARVYLGLVGVATLAAALPLVPRIHAGTHGWTAFLVLSTLAAIAQVFVVQTIRHQAYHTSAAFLDRADISINGVRNAFCVVTLPKLRNEILPLQTSGKSIRQFIFKVSTYLRKVFSVVDGYK